MRYNLHLMVGCISQGACFDFSRYDTFKVFNPCSIDKARSPGYNGLCLLYILPCQNVLNCLNELPELLMFILTHDILRNWNYAKEYKEEKKNEKIPGA